MGGRAGQLAEPTGRHPQHGIATIYQELDLVDGLSVAENIFLGHEPSDARLLAPRRHGRATAALLSGSATPRSGRRRRSVGCPRRSKQIVSMARALSHDAQLIIMDEPSAVLDPDEVENLFRLVAELTADGVAVVYISHRLEEIRRIGDRVTVLEGRPHRRRRPAGPDTATAERHPADDRPVDRVRLPAPGRAAADARRCCGSRALAARRVHRRLASPSAPARSSAWPGWSGPGRSEILETVYGARRSRTGRSRSTARRSAARLGHRGGPRRPRAVPGGAQEPGPAAVRAGLPQRLGGLAEPVRPAGFTAIRRGDRAPPRRERDRPCTRPGDRGGPSATLSGGNQQKVVLARWLLRGCRVLLLDEPTRGVDVGARSEIYRLIRRLADAGVGVVVVSSEIEEVLGLADRVLVIADGRVVHAGPADEIDEHGSSTW